MSQLTNDANRPDKVTHQRSPGRPPFYKRRWIVDRNLQGTILAFFVLSAGVPLGSLYLALRRAIELQSNGCSKLGAESTDAVVLCLKWMVEQEALVSKLFLLHSALGLLTVFFGALVISNRIAGPMYRLTRDIAAGRLFRKAGHQFKIRETDFFQELVKAINQSGIGVVAEPEGEKENGPIE